MPEETLRSEPSSPLAVSLSATTTHPREPSPVQGQPGPSGASDRSAPATSLSPELPLFQNRTVTPVATGGPMLSSAQALIRRDLWTKNGGRCYKGVDLLSLIRV